MFNIFCCCVSDGLVTGTYYITPIVQLVYYDNYLTSKQVEKNSIYNSEHPVICPQCNLLGMESFPVAAIMLVSSISGILEDFGLSLGFSCIIIFLKAFHNPQSHLSRRLCQCGPLVMNF